MRSIVLSLSIVMALTACSSVSTPEGKSGDGKVRMYSFNDKQQLIRQRFTKDTEIEGCHSLSDPEEVHRFAQFGYDYCQVFSQPNCQNGSEVAALWGGSDYRVRDIDVSEPQKILYQGGQWLLAENENVVIQSWSCSY